MGWQMGGLGGLLYLGYVLPLNGLALGIASVPLLTALLGRDRDGLRLFAPGFLLQVLVLSGMVSSIVRSHHGHVEVHSEVGKGSVFRIRFNGGQAPSDGKSLTT